MTKYCMKEQFISYMKVLSIIENIFIIEEKSVLKGNIFAQKLVRSLNFCTFVLIVDTSIRCRMTGTSSTFTCSGARLLK